MISEIKKDYENNHIIVFFELSFGLLEENVEVTEVPYHLAKSILKIKEN